MNHEERESIKARMKDISFSMYNNYDPKQEENLTADELKALYNLKSRSDIIIQKSDKGNSIVIIDKSSYIEKMESILSDTSKFGKVDLDPGKELNYIINQEKRIRSVLKILNDNGNISTSLYNNLSPTGSRPGILYGLGKVHKKAVNGSPPFRPILSAIDTPT